MDDHGEFGAAWEDQTGIKRLTREEEEKRGDMQRCTVQRQVSVGRRWGRVLMSSEKRLVFWAEVASLCGGGGFRCGRWGVNTTRK